jgi:hypothetical protein
MLDAHCSRTQALRHLPEGVLWGRRAEYLQQPVLLQRANQHIPPIIIIITYPNPNQPKGQQGQKGAPHLSSLPQPVWPARILRHVLGRQGCQRSFQPAAGLHILL